MPRRANLARWLVVSFVVLSSVAARAQVPTTPAPTREFSIKEDRPYLGGKLVDLWGLRCGNALFSEAVTERHINALDNMTAHGINLIGVYIQGSNAGWPNPEGGLDGFTRTGQLKPEVGRRLERLVREADKRGMVVMVGILSPRKDQDLYDDDAIRRAIEEAGRFLVKRNLKNVFVDIMHEFDQPDRIDHLILREPDGEAKKAKLTRWFKESTLCRTSRRASARTSARPRGTVTRGWTSGSSRNRRRSRVRASR